LVANSFWRIIVRTDVDATTAMASIRERVLALDSEMPVFWVQTMTAALDERLIPRRIPMMIVMVFAGTALLLATLGVYGVFAYTVAKRTHEIGVRVALGGTPRSIYGLILGQAASVIALGVIVGTAGALAVNRVIATQLYNVEPTDPAVLATVVAVIAAVGLVASLVPARRGARIDPMVALRDE
jgi:putative ABC transport system permease protein